MRCTLSVCNHSHHHLVEWHANTPRHRDENRNLFPFLDRTFLVSVGAAQEGSWTAEKHGNVQAFDFFRFYKSQPFRHFPRLDSLGKKNNFHKTNVLPPWKATWKKQRIDSIEKHSMECVFKELIAYRRRWRFDGFWCPSSEDFVTKFSHVTRGSSRGHPRPREKQWNDRTFCYKTTVPSVRLEQMKKQAEQKATNVKAAERCVLRDWLPDSSMVFFSYTTTFCSFCYLRMLAVHCMYRFHLTVSPMNQSFFVVPILSNDLNSVDTWT